jgi:hypothetical protein
MKTHNRNIWLFFLVVALFTNWYYYQGMYQGMRNWAMQGSLSLWLATQIGSFATKFILVGSVFGILTLLNAGLSLLIIHIYFNKDPRVTRFAFRVFAVYTGALLTLGILSFTLKQSYILDSVRHAMSILPTPMVEAVMIPLMKLYQRSLGPLH